MQSSESIIESWPAETAGLPLCEDGAPKRQELANPPKKFTLLIGLIKQ